MQACFDLQVTSEMESWLCFFVCFNLTLSEINISIETNGIGLLDVCCLSHEVMFLSWLIIF